MARVADALGKGGFLLDPSQALSIIESFPGTSAVIFFRNSKGELDLIISKPLIPGFKRMAPTR